MEVTKYKMIAKFSTAKKHRRLVSSVRRAPVRSAEREGRGFKPRPEQHSRSLNNWEENTAFVMTSANG